MSGASKNLKSKKRNQGFPEFIISFPTDYNYLIVVECKASVSNHESYRRDNPSKYAVDGVLHYAKFLAKDFNVIAIAVSGQSYAELTVSTFYYKKGNSVYIDTMDTQLLNISDYIQIFKDQSFISNFYTRDIALKARELNEEYQSYSIPEIIRCTMVSAILMSLFDKKFLTSYKSTRSTKSLVKKNVTIDKQSA